MPTSMYKILERACSHAHMYFTVSYNSGIGKLPDLLHYKINHVYFYFHSKISSHVIHK